MKKKLLIFIPILIIVSLIIFVILRDKQLYTASTLKPTKQNDIVLKVEGIKDNVLTYSITNNSDEEITFGHPYELQFKRFGKWYAYNIQINFIDIGIVCKPKQICIEEIDVAEGYGKIKKGEYRMIKEINNKTLISGFTKSAK